MPPRTLDISIVIPVWNEEGNIGPLIDRLNSTVEKLGLTAEIIIVDGGSHDDTWRIAKEKGAHCILQRRLGYGGALREGLLAAQAEYVLTMDSDLSHPPELLKEMWAARPEADIIIASRFSAGGDSEAPLMRHLLSRVLNRIFSFVLDLSIKDISSGYRLYHRAALSTDCYRPENFNILQEVLVRAYTSGYSVKEIPLHYRERASGSSHVSFIRFACSYLPTLYRLWKLRNSPESADYEYRSYFSRHPLQRYWIRRRISLIRDYLGNPAKVLDIGSGSNYLAATTPGLTALDLEPKKLRFLSRTQALPKHGEAESLPFDDGSFEQAILSQVLLYVRDVDAAIKEAHRVLKARGVLVVCVPDSRRIAWRIIGGLYNLLPNVRAARLKVNNQFSRSSLVDRFADNGFRALKYRYICWSELVIKFEKLA